MTSPSMATSSSQRSLGLRRRADLQWIAQSYAGVRYWAVKDPIALRYYHLRDEELAVLTLVDGRASLDSIRRECDERFAPRRFELAELQSLLARLHRHGLVLSDTAGQGEPLLTRAREHDRKRHYEFVTGVLAMRFRGVNPRRFLNWLAPKCDFMFSSWFVACVAALALAAVLLVSVQFDTFRARLPNVHAILQASNLPWLIVMLAVVKLFHELGHAVACRHFGGDCHEIGLMLLVFTPSLYCNVSDSWMLANKWQRIAIAAAGMYVELFLASTCTLLWWFSQPGLVNTLSMNTMLVCSVGTLVFNGNPLLRYDGYFILADLVEVPNLRAEATAAVKRLTARWCLGLQLETDGPVRPARQAWLAAYALASTLYRWFVVGAVLWALDRLAREYRLEALVVPLVVLTLVSMLWPVLQTTAGFVRTPGIGRRVALARFFVTVIVLAGLLTAALLAPLPRRVSAPLVIEYRDAERVYATVGGRLDAKIRTGQHAEKGQVLAELSNPDVALELAKLRGERDQQRLHLKNLESQRLQGLIDGSQIPSATAALADLDERLKQLEGDAAELTLVAPRAGSVLAPPVVPRDETKSDSLPHWTGTPLDPQNALSYLERGTLVCLIGDPARFEAILHVDQADVELVREGQQVRMTLDSLPGETFWGTVIDIARLDLKVMPRELAAAGDVPSRTDERGSARPLDTWYQVRVKFDDDPARLVARVHGQAKIVVAPLSLAAQISRFIRQTFDR